MCVICIPLCTYFICWSNISRLQLVCFTYIAQCQILQGPPQKQTNREMMMMCQNNIILYRVQAYTLQKQGEILKNPMKTLVCTHVVSLMNITQYAIKLWPLAVRYQSVEQRKGIQKIMQENCHTIYRATSPTSTNTLLNIL